MLRSHRIPLALLLVFGLVGRLFAGPFAFPEGRHGKGELRYVNGVPVLTVSGSPEEIGEAVGLLALKPAKRMADYPTDMLEHFKVGWLRRAFINAGNMMVEQWPEDFRHELDALAKASGVPREQLVVGNTAFDLKKMLACSAILVETPRSSTGGPVLARNLDYPSLGYAHEYSLVTIYRPTGAKHAFAAVGFPGLVGCLSGINDAGLALAVLEVFQVSSGEKRLDSNGLPYALCYRRLLEECATVAEAKQRLREMKRTTLTNLALADRESVMLLEVSPDHVVERSARNGFVTCTNHYCTEKLRPAVPINLFHTQDRLQTLDKAAGGRAPLTLANLHAALHAVHEKDETLQTMIFEPRPLKVHLAIGACPSSALPLRVIALNELLGGKGR